MSLTPLKARQPRGQGYNSDLTLFISRLSLLILSLISDWSQKQHPTPGRTILHISLTWFCKLFSSSSCFRASSLTGTSASNFFRSCALIRRKVSGEMSPCGPVAARASSRGAVSVPLLAMSDNEARYPARAFFELHRSGVEVPGWSAWPTRTTNSYGGIGCQFKYYASWIVMLCAIYRYIWQRYGITVMSWGHPVSNHPQVDCFSTVCWGW